ncbi:MFS domain-containing protein [Fusarium falciforme]|uniref:MFS domain-containing protein n=1 Tax=Fusarium falciforme TaxID=195108 RepID=UPI00230120AF|nr:MFS domain-containing protein [Fusarium falciforme]WAO91780.1 MFS domain-containing protein [Fusarium falciforme]
MVAQKNNTIVEVDEQTPLLSPHSDGAKDQTPASSITLVVFPILLAGIFLSNVVSSVVIATNQRIASEFNALSSAAWLLTIYTLAQSASQPLYGKLSDIYGRKVCLVFCWVVFGIGCLLVAVGQSYWHLLLGRAISGIGSAGKIALTSIIVADVIPLPKVAQYRGYVNLTATVARSLGGPIGGWLAGSVGWRWPFLIQLPVALAGLALVLWKLPEPKETILIDDAEPQPTGSKISRVDFAGAAMLVATVLTGLLSLDFCTKHGLGFIVYGLVGAFVLSLSLFCVIEKYYAKEPILPLELIFKREVLTSYSIVCFQAAGQFGLLYTIPIYFQVIGRESIASSSSRIVPVVVGNAFGTMTSQRLITKTQRYKGLTAFGNIVGLVGFSLIFLRWRGSTRWFDALLVALPGTGMGVIQSTTFVHLAASLDRSEIAIAGASWFLAQNIGVLMGASISTATINYALRHGLETLLRGVESRDEIIRNITSNVEYTQNLPEHLWVLVSKAYIRAIACSNALAVTLTMREKPLGGRISTPSMRRLGTLSKEELLNRIEILENQASSRATYDGASPALSQQDDDWEPSYDSTQEPPQERTRPTPRFSPEISTTLPTTRGSQQRSVAISNEQQGTHQETIWKTDPEIRRQILTTYLESMHRRVPFCDYTEILQTNEQGPGGIVLTDSDRIKLLRLYMSCAIGAAVMQLTGVSPGPRPETYFTRALELRDEIEEADLVTQTEVLLWIVLYKLRACFSSEVWYLIGSAVRTAIDADLHREHHYTTLSTVAAERHRCLFWAVYVIERNICWSLKRPFSLSDHDIDAKLPPPTTHSILSGSDGVGRPESQGESQRPLDTRVFISTIQLGRINSNAFTQLYRVDRESIDREQIPPLLDRLYQFEASLPEYCAPDYDFLQLHVKKSVCVLIEPLLSALHHSDYLIKICLEAAGSVCQLFKKLRLKRCLGYSFTMINSVFVAGTTICYVVSKVPSLWTPARANDLHVCSSSLYAAAERNPAIRKYCDTLDAIIEAVSEYVEQVLSTPGPFTSTGSAISSPAEDKSPRNAFERLGHSLKELKFEFPSHAYPEYRLEDGHSEAACSHADLNLDAIGIFGDVDLSSIQHLFTAN